jgi:hypothetical protein
MTVLIILVCSSIYVFGGYHMVPASLPYLRDVVDASMVLIAFASYVVNLWDCAQYFASFVTKVTRNTEKQDE